MVDFRNGEAKILILMLFPEQMTGKRNARKMYHYSLIKLTFRGVRMNMDFWEGIDRA
jgi:hypothetical protein